MKAYVKRTFLYFLYNELAFLIGGIAGGIVGLALHIILREYISRDLVYGVSLTVFTAVAIVYLLQREAYEKRQFSLKSIILSVLPVFALRWVLVFLTGNPAIFLCGGASSFTSILYPDAETHGALLLALVLLDLLIHLPAFLLGAYWGYRRRKQETDELTEHSKQA